MSEEVTAIQGQLSRTSSGIVTADSMLKQVEVREKKYGGCGPLSYFRCQFKTKPFLKEERLVFPLNDTQLFLPLSTIFPNLLRMMMLQLLWEIDSMNNSIFSSVQKHPKPWKSSQGVTVQRQANCRNNCLLLSRGRQSSEGMLGEHVLHLFQKGAGLL